MRHRDNRRRGNYNRNRPRFQPPPCPVCSHPVRDLYSAITHKETEKPAHFDCILKLLRDQNDLSGNEKICYLGNGSFGIIQMRHSNSPMRFFIRKRIQYELKDTPFEWRKKLIQRKPSRSR